MQIKRFEAKSMTEALRLIKKELGSEAVILSARSLKKESRLLGALKKSGVEVTAATDQLPYQPKQKSELVKRDFYTDKNDQFNFNMQVKRENQHIVSSLRSKLISQDINEDIADRLTKELKEILPSKGIMDEIMVQEALDSIISGMGVRFDPIKINLGSRKVIALIGPSGAGKTTTAVKLSTTWKFEKKRDVAMVIMDGHRIGAVDQMKTYSRIIGVPVVIVSGKSELREAIKKLRQKDLVIIDTPGLNWQNDLQLEKFYKCFEKMKKIETHLVLSATTKEKDYINIAKKLSKFEINRLIFTKIDESSTHGNILSHLVRTKIPVSCFTCGQEIPESIEEASMDRLLGLIIKNTKEKRYGIECVKKIETLGHEENKAIDIEQYFVANQNSDVFHRPGCKWTRMIKQDNIVVFKSVAEAEEKRFKPCRYCRPKPEVEYEYLQYGMSKRKIASG